MELFVDRRTETGSRVVLDAPLEFTPEGFVEPCEGDCVNLSTGGVSIRTPFVPGVGEEINCRFEFSPRGPDLDVAGRVVWAHDEGEHSGRFGVRFQGLDGRSQELIAQALAERAASGAGPAESDGRSAAQLLLEGVSAPISAHVAQRRGRLMIFEQELPLLQIGRGISARIPGMDPIHGRIASVDLRLNGDVPRLVVTVQNTPSGAAECRCESQEISRPASAPISEPDPSVPPPNEKPEGRLACELTLTEMEEAISSESIAKHKRSSMFDLPEDQNIDFKAESQSGAIDVQAALARVTAWLSEVRAWAAAFWLSAGTVWDGLRLRIGPWRARLKARIAYPAVARLINAFGSVGDAVKGLWATFSKANRPRRTAAPPLLTDDAAKRKTSQTRFSVRGLTRAALVIGLAGGTAALAVYGFYPQSNKAPVARHRKHRVAQSSEVDSKATEAATEAQPNPAPTAPANPRVAYVAPAVTPLTASGPARLGSSLLLPAGIQTASAPSGTAVLLRPTDAAHSPAPPAAAPALNSAPAAGAVFGAAEVRNGRYFTLRMSRAVTVLQGIPDLGGFTVIIPGSLSLDRAGPIAASHPLVKRSIIINKGDHSVLSINFTKGASPAYRISAKGAALEIVIGLSG